MPSHGTEINCYIKISNYIIEATLLPFDGGDSYRKSNVTSSTTYTKGSTSYGDIASSGSGTYPTNSYSGNYWYVYKGSDTIDPTAVSYDASTVIAGETVSVTISPSSGNSYGGTITYSVEVNVDETGWEPYTETTSTSFTFTIPEDAVSWRCRVKARDNLGFT